MATLANLAWSCATQNVVFAGILLLTVLFIFFTAFMFALGQVVQDGIHRGLVALMVLALVMLWWGRWSWAWGLVIAQGVVAAVSYIAFLLA